MVVTLEDVKGTADIVGKLGPLLIGIFVAFIAWRQWVTQHSKLRLDLFDRRYEIWEGFRDVRESVEFKGTVEPAHRIVLAKASRMVPFFFQDKALEVLTDKVFAKGWSASVCCNTGLRNSPDGDQRIKAFDDAQEAMTDFCTAHDAWSALAKKQMRIKI